MKIRFLKTSILAAFALVAGYGAYNAQKTTEMSDTVLANVEALASGETNGDIYCPYTGIGCIIKYTNGTQETFYGHWPK